MPRLFIFSGVPYFTEGLRSPIYFTPFFFLNARNESVMDCPQGLNSAAGSGTISVTLKETRREQYGDGDDGLPVHPLEKCRSSRCADYFSVNSGAAFQSSRLSYFSACGFQERLLGWVCRLKRICRRLL